MHNIIAIGKAILKPFQLERGTSVEDKAPFDASAATVKAVFQDWGRTRAISDAVTLTGSETGAVWDSSLIVINFTEEESAAIAETGRAWLEITVDDESYWCPVTLVRSRT